LNWPNWMEDNVWQFLIAGITIPVIGIIVAIVLTLRSKRSSTTQSKAGDGNVQVINSPQIIAGDGNVQVINSPGAIIYNVNLEKLNTQDIQLAREIQQDGNTKTKSECSLREIEEIYNVIYNYVTSLDYSKALKYYGKIRGVLDANKIQHKEPIKKIEILISEAEDERP
jgi:hypothetical protein